MLSIHFYITFSENVSSFMGETVKVEMKCATNMNRVTDEEAVLEWHIVHFISGLNVSLIPLAATKPTVARPF